MVVRSKEDVLLLCGAFHRAWMTLLLDEEISIENIEEAPGLLLGAILDVALPDKPTERLLADAGLARLKEFETEAASQTVN